MKRRGRPTAGSPPDDAETSKRQAGAATRPSESGMIVGARLHEVVAIAERIADARVPVILQGETGTGKEVVARLLHERGPRRGQRIVNLNCGAIPGELIESTFFGHERGAFTGAVQAQRGAFEEADGGTIFLDEIGELPPSAQAALLRVLEVGAFCRVGSLHEIQVDVRVIAATHRDLEAMVREGTFRADLYYRLSTFTLHIPPLRDRLDEIEPLTRRFVGLASQANGRPAEDIEPAALDRLRAYGWPGNVRELRNVIEYAVVMSRDLVLRIHHLPSRFQEPVPSSVVGPESPIPSPLEHQRLMDNYEARMIVEALEASGWRTMEAARRLKIPRRTLSRRMKNLGIRKP